MAFGQRLPPVPVSRECGSNHEVCLARERLTY